MVLLVLGILAMVLVALVDGPVMVAELVAERVLVRQPVKVRVV